MACCGSAGIWNMYQWETQSFSQNVTSQCSWLAFTIQKCNTKGNTSLKELWGLLAKGMLQARGWHAQWSTTASPAASWEGSLSSRRWLTSPQNDQAHPRYLHMSGWMCLAPETCSPNAPEVAQVIQRGRLYSSLQGAACRAHRKHEVIELHQCLKEVFCSERASKAAEVSLRYKLYRGPVSNWVWDLMTKTRLAH